MGDARWVEPNPTRQHILEMAEEVRKAAVKARIKYEIIPAYEREWAINNPNAGNGCGPYQAPPMDNRELAKIEAEERASMEWIPGYFERHIGPEPSGFDGLIDAMGRTVTALDATFARQGGGLSIDGKALDQPIATAHNQMNSLLEGWEGHAAITFKNDFIPGVPRAAANQAYIARSLQLAMEANKEIYVRARRDLYAIASTAIPALEAIGHGGGGEGAVVAFGVVAAVATVGAGLAAIPTGGASVAAALTIVAGASSLAGVAASTQEGSVETCLDADTVSGVLLNVMSAIDLLQKNVVTQEDRIAKSLTANWEEITKTPTHDQCRAPRPAMVEQSERPNGDIKNTFYPDDI